MVATPCAFALRRCSRVMDWFTRPSSQTRSSLSFDVQCVFYRKRRRAVAVGPTQLSPLAHSFFHLWNFLALCWSIDHDGREWLILSPDHMIELGRPQDRITSRHTVRVSRHPFSNASGLRQRHSQWTEIGAEWRSSWCSAAKRGVAEVKAGAGRAILSLSRFKGRKQANADRSCSCHDSRAVPTPRSADQSR